MLTIVSMNRAGLNDNCLTFKVEFEFDNASTLPEKAFNVGNMSYILAKGSTAKNIITGTGYEYTGSKWVRTSETTNSTSKTDTITDNGTYNIPNNNSTGFSDVTVDVSGGGEENNAKFAPTPATFSIRGNITSITVPDGVTSISKDAFMTCDHLTSITLPDTVISFGASAFSTCKALTSINIPSGVTELPSSVFYNTGFTEFVVPEGITTIGPTAFGTCLKLTTITIPSTVTSMNQYTFDTCMNLTTIIVHKPEGSIPGAPWGATNATIIWDD